MGPIVLFETSSNRDIEIRLYLNFLTIDSSNYIVFYLDGAKFTTRLPFYAVNYKAEIQMDCEITGTFDGFYNAKGTKLASSGRIQIKAVANTRTLVINTVTEDDAGTYTCKDGGAEAKTDLEIRGNCFNFSPPFF